MLLRAIVGQQLSTKAAAAIWTRVAGLFEEEMPTPQHVLDASPEDLRAAGLSRAKVVYMKSLAEHVLSGQLELDRLDQLGDEEVIANLTAVKGIGRWSADMFLIFFLTRPDVLAVGDLGIRKAAERLYGLPGLASPAELTRLAEPWRPWRSLGCVYLWRSLEAVPVDTGA